MLSCNEVGVALTPNEDGTLTLHFHHAKDLSPSPTVDSKPGNPDERKREREREVSDDSTLDSLVQLLIAAKHPRDLMMVLKQAWVPSPNAGEMGKFSRLDDGEVLLNTIPLFQKLLSCMASTMTDTDGAFACADLLARLCLGEESTLLLQPTEVLTTVKRLITAKRRETREGALRCITALIQHNVEYCQTFMDCKVMDFILDQIDYENEIEVATYACTSVLSLVRLVSKENDAELNTLLSRTLPSLINMLRGENEVTTKLGALRCLEEIQHIDIVSAKLKEDEVVQQLTPLLKTEDPEIKRLAIELFGKNTNASNSRDLQNLPAPTAYALLKEIYEKGAQELESMRMNLIDCLLGAVHRKQFEIGTQEAYFLSEIILKDTKACASKAIDVLIVAWDMHDGMATDLAKSDTFLAQLPHAMSVTQAALHIIHSMIKADVVAREAMAKNLGVAELQRLRTEMKDGSSAVKLIVLDIFAKLIDEENRCDDVLTTGVLEDLVDWFDSECVNLRRRCWNLCARIVEKGPVETTQKCIDLGVVPKYEILFTDFLDQQKSAEGNIQHEPGLDHLFAVLQSVSELKSGARAICDTGILSRLLEFVTPTGIVCQEIHDVIMNVLTTLPVKTSRLLAHHCGFDVLTELVKSRSIQLKRLGFEILRGLSFKECSSYLSDSAIIPQLCAFLQEANPRLKVDTVHVLCKMSKFALEEVCEQVIQAGAYSALFTASRAMNSDSEEKKMLSKIFQRLKSIEATKKAQKKKSERVVSRMNSIGSMSFQEQADMLAEMNKTGRGQSISLPTTRSRKTDKRASTLSVSFRRSRTDSCDSDIALGKEKRAQAPTGRFQKLKSLAGLRKTRHSHA